MVNKIENAIAEMIIEESWRLGRKFMREIETELECQGKLPLPLLMVSQNLLDKWNEYVRLN